LRQLPQASFGTAGANLKCIFQNRLIELFEFVAGTWRPAFNGGSDSTIGETLLRIYGGIDDLVTGDGEDIISGNDVGNWLRGMRGVDQFIGYGGNDMTWTAMVRRRAFTSPCSTPACARQSGFSGDLMRNYSNKRWAGEQV
jgi:Ca2+-binding RTX toxin-like protein